MTDEMHFTLTGKVKPYVRMTRRGKFVNDQAIQYLASKDALQLQRRATFYWDIVAAENSTGFHSPQEAARALATAIDYARQAELSASQVFVGIAR